jgi:hypothetical protein
MRKAPNPSPPANLTPIDSGVGGAQLSPMIYGQPETIPVFIKLLEDFS